MKFSILNLLLVLTMIASMMGLYASWRTKSRIVERYEAIISQNEAEITQLQSALKSLRQEAGSLTIDDPEKIHALKLRTTSENTWSYRVYLPKGHCYFVASQINSLPARGVLPEVEDPPGTSTVKFLKSNGVAIGRGPGEYIVTLTVNSSGENWEYRVEVLKSGDAVADATGGGVIKFTAAEWPKNSDWLTTGGVSKQVEFSSEENCLLLDLRAGDKSMAISGDSNQGAMIWVGIASDTTEMDNGEVDVEPANMRL